jgi:assimilatory nitrate reductase catalytic subunit
MADVVLPCTQWAEETGTMTNLEGRVILRQQATRPPEGARSDLWVMRELAARLNRPALSDQPQQIFDELRRASRGGKADYSGITYERIRRERGVFWPCPTPDHPGTPRLFTEDFPTPTRRAKFHPVEHLGPAETPDHNYPYYLTTGRLLRQYQSGTQTRRVESLAGADPVATVEMHHSLARRIGVGADDLVALRTRRGRATMRVRISSGIRADTVFASFHYGGPAAVNQLTNPALDPHSRMPEFKACAVAIDVLPQPTDEDEADDE